MAFFRDLSLGLISALLFRINQYIGRRLKYRQAYSPETEKLFRDGRSVLYVLWHGDTFLPLYAKQQTGAALLASSAVWRGDIFSGWAKKLGYEIINIPGFGADKKWIAGSLKMLRALERGKEGAVVVDGPTGPSHEVKPGIFFLSQRSGSPIIPVGVAASRGVHFFWRWDRYFLPLPGARVVFYSGAPIYLDKDAKLSDIPEMARQVGRAIDEAGLTAQRILRHSRPVDFAKIDIAARKHQAGHKQDHFLHFER